MSGTRGRPTQTQVREPDDWASGGIGGMVIEGEALPAERGGYPMANPSGGQAVDRALAQIVTAQRVAVKRRQDEIRRSISLAAQSAGSDYFYRWEVNNRKTQSKDIVEGVSIIGAMAVARIYGNCATRCIIAGENATHWTMAAEFVDYETGFTVVRQFQQRKNQNTGMRDTDRAADLVFQIAQSKAMRNVIRAALGDLCDFAVEEAKRGLLAVIEKDPEKARAGCIKLAQRLGIEGARIERVIGRSLAQWTVTDIAAAAARLRSIEDGFASADDLFPTPEQAAANAQADDPANERPMPQAAPVGETPKPAKPKAQEPAPEREPPASDGDGAPPPGDEDDGFPGVVSDPRQDGIRFE